MNTVSEEDDVTSRRRRFRPPALLFDIGFTGVTQVLSFLASVALVSLFARLIGATAVAEYLLLRRVVNWLQSGVQLGLFVAIPRFVAHAHGTADGRQEQYFAAAATCLAVLTITVSAALLLWRNNFAWLLFGAGKLSYLVLPLTLMMSGFVTHVMAYGYLRGCMRLTAANTLQIWNLCLVPVIALLLCASSKSVSLVINVASVIMICSSVFVSLASLRRLKCRRASLFHAAVELLRYGIARVPGDFGYNALFALAPVIATRFLPLEQVAPLLLGTSLVMAASISVGPLGIVLLTKISVAVAQDRLEQNRAPLEAMLHAVLDVSLFITFQLIVFTDCILQIWVGPSLAAGATVVRLVVLAIPFFLLFSAARSVIDAVTEKAENSRNILLSNLVFFLAAVLSITVVKRAFLLALLGLGFVSALLLLAVMTLVSLKKLCGVRLSWKGVVQSLLTNCIFMGVAVALRNAIPTSNALLLTTSVESFLAVIYVAVLVVIRPPWWTFLYARYLVARTARPGIQVLAPR